MKLTYYFRYERLNDSEIKLESPNAVKQCRKKLQAASDSRLSHEAFFCYCQECIAVDPDLNPEKLKNLSMPKQFCLK